MPMLEATCFDHDRIILATGDDAASSPLISAAGPPVRVLRVLRGSRRPRGAEIRCNGEEYRLYPTAKIPSSTGLPR